MKQRLALLALLAAAIALVFFWKRGCPFAALCLLGGEAPRPAAEAPAGGVENDPRLEGRVGRDPELAEHLVGEWRSLDDASFVRVLAAGGNFHDTYQGDAAGAPGTWALAGDGSGELRLSSEGDTMRFDVISITENSLAMIYLDRGNLLRFERVN